MKKEHVKKQSLKDRTLSNLAINCFFLIHFVCNEMCAIVTWSMTRALGEKLESRKCGLAECCRGGDSLNLLTHS